MINETEKMRDARHALEQLSASDPAAQANMLRHVAAVRIMLTGQYQCDADEPLLIAAGFLLKGGSAQIPAGMTRRDGVDRIYIAFDVDDPAGPAIGMGLFRKNDDIVSCYGLCRLWMPADGERALVIPAADGSLGGFAYTSDIRFRHVETPSEDLMAGFHRARRRLAELLNADELLDRGASGYVLCTSTDGWKFRTQTARFAA